MLSQQELIRYQRHFNLPNVGIKGQKKLKQAKILCIGAGGLGSAVLPYLAAAGVGHIGIVDDDVIELSNLQRQILYNEETLQQAKVNIAAEKLKTLNSQITIETYQTKLHHNNALQLIEPYDLVIDGSDNFQTRYIVNDACFHLAKPHIYASILRFEGQCSVFTFKNGPCYRCLFPAPPPPGAVPNCQEGGVLGVLPGILGTLQANEALKLILQIGQPLSGQLLLVNSLTMDFRKTTLRNDPACVLCHGKTPYDKLNFHQLENCQMTFNIAQEITVKQLKKMQDQKEDFFLLDVRNPHEYEICHLGGHLIPLAELPDRLNEIDKTKQIVVHCKMGGRSLQAVQFLQEHGFKNVYNLQGGINAYAVEVDPNIAQY